MSLHKMFLFNKYLFNKLEAAAFLFLSDYARKIEYYTFGRHPRNKGIMLKIMLSWKYNAEIMPDWNDTSTPSPIGPYLLIKILKTNSVAKN